MTHRAAEHNTLNVMSVSTTRTEKKITIIFQKTAVSGKVHEEKESVIPRLERLGCDFFEHR